MVVSWTPTFPHETVVPIKIFCFFNLVIIYFPRKGTRIIIFLIKSPGLPRMLNFRVVYMSVGLGVGLSVTRFLQKSHATGHTERTIALLLNVVQNVFFLS